MPEKMMPAPKKVHKNKSLAAAAAALLACVAVLICTLQAMASADNEHNIFVAGNPELYPIEYYDSSDGEYHGLLPDIYDIISQNTDYSFIYINSGSTNGQNRMAKKLSSRNNIRSF